MLSIRNELIILSNRMSVLSKRARICNVDKRLKSDASNINVRDAKFARPLLRQPGQDSKGRAYFLLVIPMSALWLGCWQIKRKIWKEELVEKMEMKTKLDAVPLPSDWNELQELEYRKIKVRGVFDHSKEQYLGPRTLLANGESTYGGKLMTTKSNDSSGYLVVTPFILSDTGERILVNRGWIPFSKKKPSTRPEGQIKEEVEIEGVVRLSEPPPQFSPVNKLDVQIWFHRNVEGMADFAECSPVFLDATASSTVPGGPVGGQTRISLRNEHLSYILTWFSLSAATSYMWYMKYVKRAY